MGKDTIILSLILFNIFFIAFVGGVVIFIRQYRKKKKLHTRELETVSLLHRKELLKTQLEIQVQTMKHIGQEIHDNIGQKLTLASIYLQQLDYENKVPLINKHIIPINDILNQSLIELRQLSKSLTDDSISALSISDLLSGECQIIRDLKIYKVSFKDDIDMDIDSYRIKSILLRITQEFFQNSIKHANCKNISVNLSRTNTHVCLMLKDDGKGFNPDNTCKNGIGLDNMRKRTQMLNGNFNLKSNIEHGTELGIEIPI